MSHILAMFGKYGATWSGAERMGWKTISHLAARGHTLSVHTDSTWPSAGDDFPALGRMRPAACPPADTKPAVIHAFDLGNPAYVRRAVALARRTAIPLALTPATAVDLWPDLDLGRAACRDAAVIFTLSDGETEALVALGAPRERIRRIPQAPDLSGRPDPAAFRRRLGITGRVVLFLGRRIPTKGYQAFLGAAPYVWRRLPQTTFIAAGQPGAVACDPPSHSRIIDLAVVDEQTKHDALAGCDVLCLPTTADVFPLVFAEAWACGKPVVSGPFAGAREVVRDGVDGLVVETHPACVGDALVQLLGDDIRRRSMGAAGFNRARHELSWEAVATAVENGYRETSYAAS
jgi:glycosyltransferase involved in cell wall biosynthesis